MLSVNVKKDVSEKDYENQVIRAIEKLDWREYTGEIKRQPEFKIGRHNTIRPDLAIYGANDEPLIMIEIKRPSEQLSKEEPADQLVSCILQSQSDFGLLIGSSIRLFYNGKDNPQREPILIDRIAFNKDSEEGKRFVSIFQRSVFLKAAYKNDITTLINKFTAKRNIKKLKDILIQEDNKMKIRNFLKKEYSEYGPDVVDGALNALEIGLSFKGESEHIKVGNRTRAEVNDDQKEGMLKTVFEIIKDNPEEINTTKLIKQITGFKYRQITNALYKLKKRGTIKSDGRGKYIANFERISTQKRERVAVPNATMQKISIEGTIYDAIYEEIKKHKSGCTKDNLKTVFKLGKRQLSNALYKLKKKGFIQSLEQGMYIAK